MIEEINEQEYIGIAEFAKRVNVSKQAVYQQLDKKLKAYLIVDNGIKKLNTRAISEVYGKIENQENSKEIEQDLTKALIDSLSKQLIEKDKQIDGLIKSLSVAQMQLTEVSHRLQQLTDKSHEEMQQSVEYEEKQQNVAEDSQDQRIQALEQEIERLEIERNLPWWKKIFNK